MTEFDGICAEDATNPRIKYLQIISANFEYFLKSSYVF